jgi:hypothetical protein
VLHTSLPLSDRNSSLLSEAGGTDLKQSGLPCSVPSSATKNLAYLPCRLERDGSTFPFFSGGGVSKKALRTATPPDLFSSQLDSQVWPVLFLRSDFHAIRELSCCCKVVSLPPSCPLPGAASGDSPRVRSYCGGSSAALRASCFIARPTRSAGPGILPPPLLPQGLRFSGPAGRSRRVHVSPPPVSRARLFPVAATIVPTS